MLTALMRPTWLLGTNALSARRGRSALLTAAVALAAALVVAVSTCMNSVQGQIESRLRTTLGSADARIVHLFNGRFPASLLDTVKSWPEVDRAVGRFSAALTLTRPDGRADPDTGLPRRLTPQAHGVDPPDEFEMRPIELTAGRYPERDNEIAIDSFVARQLEVGVGDDVVVQRFGEPITLRVVGIFDRPILGALQRPQIQMLRPLLEEASERRGSLTDIAIELKEGADIDAFCAAHLEALPEQLSLEPAEMASTGFDRRLRAARVMFAIGSFFVFIACSFIIVIGMTTGVTERQRELAITRCFGATKAQIFLSQMWMGVILGTIGAAIGVPLGIGLAWTLITYFEELLPNGVSIGWMGIALAGVGSMLAGLGGALWPALSASRVSPLQAAASRATPPRLAHAALFATVAIALIAGQIVLFDFGDASARFWTYALAGLPMMQIGYFLLAVPAFIMVAVVLARPLSVVFRLPGDLLRQSALSIPYRLGLTAGALMIGIAILTSTWTSTTAVLGDWLGKMTFADGFAFNRTGMSKQVREQIASLDFVRDLCPIAYLPLEVQSGQVFGVEGIAPPNVICIGFDPDIFFQVNRVEWIEGDPESALARLRRGDGVLVAEQFLAARGIGVGDSLTLGAGRVSHEYEIVGVVTAAGLDVATQMFGIRNVYNEHALSCVFADLDAVTRQFDSPDVYLVQVNLTREITDEDALREITAVAPGTWFVSGRKIKETIDVLGSALLVVNATVAFTALLLASIAVGNVLVANVASRKFEYGVLRAVGASRGHLARLVAGEAVLLAITAAIVGTVFGLHAAANDIRLHRDLGGLVVAFHVPWLVAGIGCAALITMTLVAAAPAALGLARATPRALLSAGRGGA